METFIITLFMLTFVYFVLRKTFYKDKSFKALIIFSVFFNAFIVVLNLNNVIKGEIEIVYYVLSIVFGLILTISGLVITYYKEVKYRDSKTITIKHKTIKFYKLASLLALMFDALLVGVMFLVNPTFDNYKITHIVILSGILLWNIFYNLYFIKNKVKGELIIVVTNDSYMFYDVKEKFSYKLNDYIQSDKFILNKTIIGLYKTYLNDNRYIRVFYVSKYKVYNPQHDKNMFKLLKEWDHPTIILDLKDPEQHKIEG